MRIANPRHQPATPRPGLAPGERSALRAALAATLAAWPEEPAEITLAELGAALRAALAGVVPPEAFDGAELVAALRAQGVEPLA